MFLNEYKTNDSFLSASLTIFLNLIKVTSRDYEVDDLIPDITVVSTNANEGPELLLLTSSWNILHIIGMF